MISEFIFERGKKKCRKYIKNKGRKKEKDGRDERRKLRLAPIYLLYFSFISLFLFYFSFIHFFISLDLLYFRSQSCNGFTPLCFLSFFIFSQFFKLSLLRQSQGWFFFQASSINVNQSRSPAIPLHFSTTITYQDSPLTTYLLSFSTPPIWFVTIWQEPGKKILPCLHLQFAQYLFFALIDSTIVSFNKNFVRQ